MKQLACCAALLVSALTGCDVVPVAGAEPVVTGLGRSEISVTPDMGLSF